MRPTRPTQLMSVVDTPTEVLSIRKEETQPLRTSRVRGWWFTTLLGIGMVVWAIVAFASQPTEPAARPGVVNAPTTSAATATPTPTNSSTATTAAPTPTPTPTPSTATVRVTVAGPTVYVTQTVTQTVTATATVTETVTATPTPPPTPTPSPTGVAP